MIEENYYPRSVRRPAAPQCPFCSSTNILQTFAEANGRAETRLLCRTCGRATQRPFSFYDLDDDLLFIFDSSGVQGSTQSPGPKDASRQE